MSVVSCPIGILFPTRHSLAFGHIAKWFLFISKVCNRPHFPCDLDLLYHSILFPCSKGWKHLHALKMHLRLLNLHGGRASFRPAHIVLEQLSCMHRAVCTGNYTNISLKLCLGPGQETRAWEPMVTLLFVSCLSSYLLFHSSPLTKYTFIYDYQLIGNCIYHSCDFSKPSKYPDVCWLIELMDWDFLFYSDSPAR